jgi:hypothetical protein
LSYGTTYYVKLVAVNLQTKKSSPSAQGSGSPLRITGLDIEDGQISVSEINFTAFDIGGANAYYVATTTARDALTGVKNGDIAYITGSGYATYRYNGTTWLTAPEIGVIAGTKILAGTLTASAVGTNLLITASANIGTAVIDQANISTVSAGSIVAGTMSADVVVSGRFASPSLTGARREMNSVGFQAWDASGNQTISFDGVNNLLTGILKTALTGRRIESGASGNTGQIAFYSSGGTASYLASEALSGGNEGISVRLPLAGKGVYWNTFRIDTTGLAFIDAKYTHFGFGGAAGGGGDFRVAFATDTGTSTTFPTLVDRLYIDENLWEAWFNTSGGYFLVSEKNLSNGVDVIRQQMWGGGAIAFTKSPGGDFVIQERAVGGGSFYDRFRITNTAIQIRYAPTKDGRLLAFNEGPLDSTTYFSPEVQLVSSIGYGAFFRFQTGSGGTGSKVVLRDAGDSIYEDLFVGTLTQSSSAQYKTNVRPLDGSAMERLNKLVPAKFNRKRAGGWEERETVGLIAEDVIEEIRTESEYGPGIALLPLATLQVKAQQETYSELQALKLLVNQLVEEINNLKNGKSK